MLKKQGLVKGPTTELEEREKTQKDNDMWLAEHRRSLAQREVERMRSRASNKDQHQREYDNRVREQMDAREQMEAFKNYKPDVQIVYYDDFGRAMDTKEAWKALSHRFHGKGSGKAKTEKRLKKIAEEKKREAMISGDTPTSMNDAFHKRQEKAGQAHMVLSVGNRGFAHSDFYISALSDFSCSSVRYRSLKNIWTMLLCRRQKKDQRQGRARRRMAVPARQSSRST